MKKMLFVLNPCAGTKKANRFLADILDAFNRAGYQTQVYVTAGPKDAVTAVEQFAPGMDLVVCCGGDGTFNETVTGLLNVGLSIPVGYIPAGSTNDFANSLELPLQPLKAAMAIIEGTPTPLDMGSFNGRYFSYVASFGAFTKASYATPQSVKNALGHTAYVLEGIKEIASIRKMPVRMELDGEVVEDDYIFGAICNSTSVGGILTLDPNQVDMSDGKFEILLLRAPRDLFELTECITAVQKQQYNSRMMTFRTAKTVQIHASEDMTWTLDGEMADGAKELTVSNLHHAIQLVH